MKHRTVIFTYERPELLANARMSVERFAALGECWIVDDGSQSWEMKRELSLAEKNGWKVIRVDRTFSGLWGGFFKNHYEILRQAVVDGCTSLFTMEDDHQLVAPLSIDRASRVFSGCPDCVVFAPMFLRRISTYSLDYISEYQVYRRDRGCQTGGWWNLFALKTHGIPRVEHETLMSQYWLKRSYRVYNDAHPSLAVVPHGMTHLPLMTDEAESRLNAHPWDQLPVQEHYLPTRLVWHRADRTRFRELCRERLKSTDRIYYWPRWTPAAVKAVKSHVTWEPKKPGWRGRIPYPKPLVSLRHWSLWDALAALRLEYRLKREQKSFVRRDVAALERANA